LRCVYEFGRKGGRDNGGGGRRTGRSPFELMGGARLRAGGERKRDGLYALCISDQRRKREEQTDGRK